jgi:benzoyl-CoA 2,3-dioxygenase component B
MLTEEAHHMFVGETGVDRVVQRTCELMKAGGDVRAQGGIDLPTLQKYLNLWFSLSEDLFGGEISSNAADFFAAGLKGRYKEAQYEDHRALEGNYPMTVLEGGQLAQKDVPLRTAMNEVLRDNYVEDCQRAVDKWNRTIERSGATELRLALPNRRFHRNQGIYAGTHFDPGGRPISAEAWQASRDQWLPSEVDYAYVESLMKPVHERGKIASWLAPPARGINGQSFDYEYVRA